MEMCFLKGFLQDENQNIKNLHLIFENEDHVILLMVFRSCILEKGYYLVFFCYLKDIIL